MNRHWIAFLSWICLKVQNEFIISSLSWILPKQRSIYVYIWFWYPWTWHLITNYFSLLCCLEILQCLFKIETFWLIVLTVCLTTSFRVNILCCIRFCLSLGICTFSCALTSESIRHTTTSFQVFGSLFTFAALATPTLFAFLTMHSFVRVSCCYQTFQLYRFRRCNLSIWGSNACWWFSFKLFRSIITVKGHLNNFLYLVCQTQFIVGLDFFLCRCVWVPDCDICIELLKLLECILATTDMRSSNPWLWKWISYQVLIILIMYSHRDAFVINLSNRGTIHVAMWAKALLRFLLKFLKN